MSKLYDLVQSLSKCRNGNKMRLNSYNLKMPLNPTHFFQKPHVLYHLLFNLPSLKNDILETDKHSYFRYIMYAWHFQLCIFLMILKLFCCEVSGQQYVILKWMKIIRAQWGPWWGKKQVKSIVFFKNMLKRTVFNETKRSRFIKS